MKSYAQKLQGVDTAQARLEAQRLILIEKAAHSDNPDDLIAAAQAVEKITKQKQQPSKAFFIDPLEFNANLGYKDKPYSLTYTTLQRMSKAPIINAIIKTRKNQVADFAEPQANQYSTGFVVRKKAKMGVEQKMDNKDKKIANAITDFILNCGSKNSWTNDDFDDFIRKIVDDSLIYDQMTFECIRSRKGTLERFVATDASTFRMADSAYREDYDNPFFAKRGGGMWFNQNLRSYTQYDVKNGYYPQYVQIYQNAVVNDFYPWELCFAVRNPSSSIYANGYGCSELEELINVVTSMLWGDEYNRRFFSQGSAPKGLLRIKGGMNESAIAQFKQQWQAMISGVMQSWKTPVVQADVDWIDLQKTNRDMEFNGWMEYLIKIACAIFSMDPSEIGWDISRSGGNSGLFEGSQAERLQHSKDKGLYPLLKFLQRKINKYIIEPINPDFEFVFMGLNGDTIDNELDRDVKKMQNFMTINEIRQKWDREPIENGDIIANTYFQQAKQAADQAAQQQSMMGDMGGDGGYDDYSGYDEESPEGDESGSENQPERNPFDLYYEDEEGSGEGNEDAEQNDESSEEEGNERSSNIFDDVYDEENGDEEDEDEDDDSSTDDEEEDDEDKKKAENDVFVKAFEAYLKQEENELKK